MVALCGNHLDATHIHAIANKLIDTFNKYTYVKINKSITH